MSRRSEGGGGGDGRNRRMMTSIQSVLGKNPGAPTPSRSMFDGNNRLNSRRKPREIPESEKLKSVDDVIDQIANLSIRGERSTAQIKRNIESNPSTLDEMWDEEWEKLVNALIKAALNIDEAPFVVDLLPLFMKYPDFIESFRDKMMDISSRFVMPPLIEGEDGEKKESIDYDDVPSFLGTLLCARWPRGLHRDTEECNPLLFTAFQIVRGWMLVMEGIDEREERNDNERGRKAFEENHDDDEEGGGEGEGGDDDQDKNKKEDDVVKSNNGISIENNETEEEKSSRIRLLNRCATALSSLCHSQQRSLWFQRPELVDEMYKCIKPAITSNNHITPDVKSSLLHCLILMHDWTRSKAVNTRCAATQTAPTS